MKSAIIHSFLNGAESMSPAGPDRGSGGWLNRRKIISVAVAVLIAVGVGVGVGAAAQRPDDVVRGYLTAIQHKDVGQALRIAGARVPKDESAAFLSADVLSGGWRFEVRRWRYLEPTASAARAEVTVTLSDAAGSTTHDGTFQLTRRSGHWRLDDPFVDVRFPESPLQYIEINNIKHTAPTPTQAPATRTYLLFPGRYLPYAGHSDLVTVAPGPLFAIPGNTDPIAYTPTLTVTESGRAAFQQAVNTLIARCASPAGDQRCNLLGVAVLGGTEFAPVPAAPPPRVLSGHAQVTTEIVAAEESVRVTRYPVVDIPGQWARLNGQPVSFVVQVKVPGQVRITLRVPASQVVFAGHHVTVPGTTFTRLCQIVAISVGISVTADGAVTTQWVSADAGTNAFDLRCAN
jgi:hypothetical protein